MNSGWSRKSTHRYAVATWSPLKYAKVTIARVSEGCRFDGDR